MATEFNSTTPYDGDYYRSTSTPTTALAPARPVRFAPGVPLRKRVHVRLLLTGIDPYALITFGVAFRFLICLAAIWMGIVIAVHAPNDGVAIMAALACGGVIRGLLGRVSR